MIFTIFAFVLFGALVLSNKNIMENSTTLAAENEVSLAALASAQSIVEEAKTKAFDQNTVGGVEVSDSSGLSSSIGLDAGEIAPPSPDTVTATGFESSTNFNDIDDYNGYKRLVKMSNGKDDKLIDSVTVKYVKFSNPEDTSGTRTYLKKMTITVTTKYIPRPYTFTYIFSY
ncbi:MAG: hypothetical protein HY033_12430 [Ignavibacteriae bacterium]|nr:hypothetical protein [Ignavibacteria bacterium]MBI3365699.1 hypothetical protein [Ignavibacteriota bacterium]